MRLPAYLFGTLPDVKKACRRAASRIRDGATLSQVSTDWLPVAETPGDILTSEFAIIEPYEAREAHFHTYLLVESILKALGEDVFDPRWESLFDEIVETPWAMYGCLSHESYFLFRQPKRSARFIRAVRDHWQALNGPGRRFRKRSYSAIADEKLSRTVSFWQVADSAGFCLCELGAESEAIKREWADPAYHLGAMPSLISRYADLV